MLRDEGGGVREEFSRDAERSAHQPCALRSASRLTECYSSAGWAIGKEPRIDTESQ